MARRNKRRNSRQSKQKIQNSEFGANKNQSFQSALASAQSGAGYCNDLGSSYFVNHSARTFEQKVKNNYSLYQNTWEGKKIVNIPVFDLLRNGWDYDGLSPEQTKCIETTSAKLQVLNRFKEALRLERLVGGAVIFLGVSDGADSPKEPLRIGEINLGSLRFINTISRTKVSDITLDIDPLSSTYGRPKTYYINGQEVHHSRLIIFDGDPITQAKDDQYEMINTRNDGFGQAVLDNVYYEIIRAIGTRQAAFQLVNKTGQFFAMMDMASLEGTEEGNNKLEYMEKVLRMLSMYNGAIIDSNSTDGGGTRIETISPNFASVPELVEKYLQVLSAASDSPATRFLGQAPSGLNATGKSDLENYYGRLESEQELILKPKIEQLLKVLVPSCFGDSVNADSVSVEFEPLWSISETDKVTNDNTIATKYTQLVTTGILAADEAKLGLERENAIPSDIAPDSISELETESVDVSIEVNRLKELLSDSRIE